MSEEKTIPTWGYKGSKAQIFQLKEGESLPSGWSDSPATAAEEKPKRGRKAKAETEAEDDPDAEDELSEDESEDDGEDSQ